MKTHSGTRRDFLRKSALAAGATVTSVTIGQGTQPLQINDQRGVITDRAKRLMERFALKYPIFQGAPGGEKVALAMSRVGCMGAMGLGWFDAAGCKDTVTRLTKSNTTFYGNFVLHFPPANVEVALQSGLKIIQL